jgi:hypothetical protein
MQKSVAEAAEISVKFYHGGQVKSLTHIFNFFDEHDHLN